MKNKTCRILRVNSKGFTLIEIVISMLISAIVMAAIYGVFISSSESQRTQEGVVDAQQRARAGLDFMVRNIRIAGLDPLNSSVAGIEVAQAQKIRFTADMNMNGTINNTADEQLTYEYDAANQTLDQTRYETVNPPGSTQPLVDRVSALNFTYLDADGAVTATLADIRSVVITISCQGTGKKGQTLTRTLSTRVNCRNLSM